jgi:hypothetical protein
MLEKEKEIKEKNDFKNKFFIELMKYYEKSYKDDETLKWFMRIYYNSLCVHSIDFLEKSLQKIYETCKYFPKLSEIIDVIRKIDDYTTALQEDLNSLPPEHRKIKEKLKENFDEKIYNSWISKLKIKSVNNCEIVFEVPNGFIKDWITNRFLEGTKKKKDKEIIWIKKGIKQILLEEYPELQSIKILLTTTEVNND